MTDDGRTQPSPQPPVEGVALAASSLDCGMRSHPGRDPEKQVNEDAGFHRMTPLGYLAVVCDGMGGHAGGQEASNLAVETIAREFDRAGPQDDVKEVLRRSIELANAAVHALGHATPRARPGSTVVAIVASEAGVDVAHVGDSRVYRVHGTSIEPVTRDHSAVQQLVDAGVLTYEQAKVHPEANKITRALGMAESVEVEVARTALPYAPGDTFVLCSDGLSDLVEPRDILGIVTQGAPQQAAGQLVELANARGGHDNITAVVLRLRVSSRRDLAPTAVDEGPRTVVHTAVGTPIMPKVSGVRETVMMTPVPGPSVPPAHPSGPQLPLDSSSYPSLAPSRRPPATTHSGAPSRAPLLIGLVLGLLGVATALYVFYRYWQERAGEHRVAPTVTLAPPPGPVPASSAEARPPDAVPNTAPGPTPPLGSAAGPVGTEDDPPLPTLAPHTTAPRPHPSHHP